MAGIELVLNRETKVAYPFDRRIGHHVAMEARERGLIIRPLGDVVVLMPPLATPDALLQEMARITYDSIRTATED